MKKILFAAYLIACAVYIFWGLNKVWKQDTELMFAQDSFRVELNGFCTGRETSQVCINGRRVLREQGR